MSRILKPTKRYLAKLALLAIYLLSLGFLSIGIAYMIGIFFEYSQVLLYLVLSILVVLWVVAILYWLFVVVPKLDAWLR